jgi:hypothetical protein
LSYLAGLHETLRRIQRSLPQCSQVTLLFTLLLYHRFDEGWGGTFSQGAAVPVFPTPSLRSATFSKDGDGKSASMPRRQRGESHGIGGQRIAAPHHMQVGPNQNEIAAVNIAGAGVRQVENTIGRAICRESAGEG